MNKKDLDFCLFGHRGAAREAPENTLGGFEHAWQNGIRAFELDVHITRDDRLVVIHDRTLDRTTDGAGQVAGCTLEELSSLNAAHHFPGWEKREEIPLLEKVLERYQAGILRWQLEIKTKAAERLELLCTLLAGQIERYGLSERVTVTSFNTTALQVQRRVAPHLRLGLITEPAHMEHVALAISLDCADFCVPIESGSAALIAASQKAGLYVAGWVANTPEDIDTLLDWGVDAMTSDVPTFARQYLIEHL